MSSLAPSSVASFAAESFFSFITMPPCGFVVGPSPLVRYYTADEAKEKGFTALKLSGTKFRQMLRAGEDIPEWFAFKSVVEVLREEWK